VKNSNLSLLLLRLMGGGLMLLHGYPKLLKIINGEMGFADPLGIGEGLSLYLAVFAEFVCSILLLVGLYVRWAVVPYIFTMVIAVFVVHAGEPLQKQELALLYLGIGILIMLNGSGKYSLDYRIKRRGYLK
jgi:putative oxidoreductase